MEHYLRLLEAGTFDLFALITYSFRLVQFQEAFLMMQAKARHSAVKAVFDFREA